MSDFEIVPIGTIELLKSLKWTRHNECDDGWYSCPMAENYFGKFKGKYCGCGLKLTIKSMQF